MERKLVIIVEADEKQLCPYPGDEPVARMEAEMGLLESHGIKLTDCRIFDEDDEVKYARYLNYLVTWAMNQYDEDPLHPSPLTYDEWVEVWS